MLFLADRNLLIMLPSLFLLATGPGQGRSVIKDRSIQSILSFITDALTMICFKDRRLDECTKSKHHYLSPAFKFRFVFFPSKVASSRPSGDRFG